MNRARSLFWFTVVAAIIASHSPLVSACTACFGQSDSNMAKGMNMGIFALLLVITSVLCGVAGFFVFLARRNSHLNDPHYAPNFSQNRTNA